MLIENPKYIHKIISWYEREIDKLIENSNSLLKTDFAIQHVKGIKISLNKILKQIGTSEDSMRLTLDEPDLKEFQEVIRLVLSHYRNCLEHDETKIEGYLGFTMKQIRVEREKAETHMKDICDFKIENKDPPPPI